MFLHADTGSVSLNRDEHMQHGGMRRPVHFPLKAACASGAHARACARVSSSAVPTRSFLSCGTRLVLCFTASLTSHPPSQQVSLAVSCEDKSSHPPARLRTIGALVQNRSDNRQEHVLCK